MSIAGALSKLTLAVNEFGKLDYEPLPLSDPFLLTACLQKSLRRSDAPVAIGAALGLCRIDPARFWRRLVIVAFEDFGLVNTELTTQIVAAASDKGWRKKLASDEKIASYFVDRLLSLPRDRRVDELYMLAVAATRRGNGEEIAIRAKDRPSLMVALGMAMKCVSECERSVPFREVWATIAHKSDNALADMVSSGCTISFDYETLAQARRTSQCLLPVVLPIAEFASRMNCHPAKVVQNVAPEVDQIGCVPSYALDGYTRIGRQALAILLDRNVCLARLLGKVPQKARVQALVNILFAVEGGISALEVSDEFYDALKHLSVGCWSGLSSFAFVEAANVMRVAIPDLNYLRRELWLRAMPS